MDLEIDSGNLNEIDSARFGTWLEKQVQPQTTARGLAHGTRVTTGNERATYLGRVRQLGGFVEADVTSTWIPRRPTPYRYHT